MRRKEERRDSGEERACQGGEGGRGDRPCGPEFDPSAGHPVSTQRPSSILGWVSLRPSGSKRHLFMHFLKQRLARWLVGARTGEREMNAGWKLAAADSGPAPSRTAFPAGPAGDGRGALRSQMQPMARGRAKDGRPKASRLSGGSKAPGGGKDRRRGISRVEETSGPCPALSERGRDDASRYGDRNRAGNRRSAQPHPSTRVPSPFFPACTPTYFSTVVLRAGVLLRTSPGRARPSAPSSVQSPPV